MRQVLSAIVLFLVPASASGQGRLIARPCAPPPCVPANECQLPRPVSCGPHLERISNTVHVKLADRVLRYEVTEVFRNAGATVAEADYIFPLPAGAAFEDLKLSINGELVAGETMAADKARGIYEEIVRRQRDPALVEWMGAGLLRARIFPIAPGEEKTVVVRYQSVAQREGDALRIDYRRGTDPMLGRAALTTPARPAPPKHRDESGETWSRFTLEYTLADTFGTPYSPTHTLRTREDGRRRLVEARGVSGDVTVLLPLRRNDAAAMSVLTHAPDGERGFALITVSPPAEAPRGAPRDLTFVVDVSGSMVGKKLEQAKAAGHALLQSLRDGDRFRIIDFATDVREFRENVWTTVTDANLKAARRYIDELRATGSTNISEALTIALDAPASSRERLPLVVFVTDGEPTVGLRDANAIAALAAEKRGNARIFSVGVTTGINAALIEQLAVEGRGTAHFVRNDESVEATVSLLARRLSAPVLTDVRIRANGVRLSQLLPAGPIDVFAGQDLVVLARYDGAGAATVQLEGNTPNGPVTWTTRATFNERERANPFVARLWAAQRIGWLAAEKRRNGGSTELNDEIRSLGERYGIPTEYSSYLVLEPGTVAPAPVVGQSLAAVTVQAQSNVVERGKVASQAVAAAGPPTTADARFEAARSSAEQRSAQSVAAIDGVRRDGSERIIGNRRFILVDSVWTDSRLGAGMRRVRIKPFTMLYFDLMTRLDDLSQPFALGSRVVVAGRAVAIEVHDTGLDTMSNLELQQLLRDWK